MDQGVSRLCCRIAIRREVLPQDGRVVVADGRNLVRPAADYRVDHPRQRLVLRELARSVPADFDIDDQRERLVTRILLKVKLLGNSIVFEDEIAGAERKDEFVALIANQAPAPVWSEKSVWHLARL